ncbi:MAG: hypothetical protein WA991_07810 [Ornithinimicrobium sp.]
MSIGAEDRGDSCLLLAGSDDETLLGEALLSPLGVNEQARLGRLRSAERRESFLVGHLLVRRAVAAVVGEAALVDQHEDGSWGVHCEGRQVSASLSHAGRSVIALATTAPVCGVDAEHTFSPERARLLTPWILAPGDCVDGDDPRTLTQVWVAKEALAKTIGCDLAETWRHSVVAVDRGSITWHGGKNVAAAKQWAVRLCWPRANLCLATVVHPAPSLSTMRASEQ